MRAGSLECSIDVRLPHSDAAGVLFYANAFVLEQECYERWLEAGGISLREMLDGTLAPTPVVHCDADFSRPVRVGDRLWARLAGVGIGRGSFVLGWDMRLEGTTAISVRVRRACIDAVSGRAIDVPDRLRAWLGDSQHGTASIT